jgi:hypothetical protein
MNQNIKRGTLVAASLVAMVGLGTGCSRFGEEYNDAPVQKKNDRPAEVYSMPDGFANVATKCDNHGNRMYVTRQGDSAGKSVAVVANDPSCAEFKEK